MVNSIYVGDIFNSVRSGEWARRFCAVCIVRGFSSRQLLQDAIFKCHPRDHHGREQVSLDECERLGHDIVTVPGRFVVGPRRAQSVEKELATVAPMLLDKPIRFNEREKPSKEVEDAVAVALGRWYIGDRLTDTLSDPRSVRRGEVEQETRLERELGTRTSDVDVSRRQRGWQARVTFHDGYPVLRTLISKAVAAYERLDADKLDMGDGFMQEHTSYMMERYAEAAGVTRLLDRACVVGAGFHFPPTVMELRNALGADGGAFTELVGDVSIIQFEATRRAWLFSDVRTHEHLYDALARFGYRRLAASNDRHNGSQRADTLIKDMAKALLRVEINTIDWSPLLRVRFSHAKNSGPSI